MFAWLFLLQTALTIAVSGPSTSPEYLPLRLAAAEGYFAEEGLRVSLRTTPAEAGAAEALARSQVDLAATSIDAALRLGHVQGVPPRLVFGLTRAAPTALLIAPALRGFVTSPADLSGRIVGIPAPGTPEHTQLLSLLARAGISRHVSVQSYGEQRLSAALDSGEVPAVMIGDPGATRLIEEGKGVPLVDLRSPEAAASWLGGSTVHAALFVRADTTLTERELTPLARALLKAMDRLRSASPDELAARLPSAVTGLPEEWRARQEGSRGVFLQDGLVTVDALKASVTLVRARSPMPTIVVLPKRMDALLFTQPLREALATRPR